MEKLEEVLYRAEFYHLNPIATDEIRSLLKAFEKNPFFPVSRYEYAKAVLQRLWRLGELDANLMQEILNEF